MSGFILASGNGTKLYPLTKSLNVYLLPVGSEPIIYNPIHNMQASRIKEFSMLIKEDVFRNNVFEKLAEYFSKNYENVQKGRGAIVLLVKVSEPQRIIVATLDERKVVEIQEKPE